MDLTHLERNWDDLGRVDPLWAILADPRRHGNRWTREDFFATGVHEVRGYLDLLDELGLGARRGVALDFGSGAGRLTQALSRSYSHVVGVDIAASMTALAAKENLDRNPHWERVSFITNSVDHLGVIDSDSVDLVLSIVVLQHMNNALKSAYLREFVRVLRPGGVAVFTVPSHADRTLMGWVRRLPNPIQNIYRRRRYGYRSVMEFHTMSRTEVEAAVSTTGGSVVAVRDDPMAGPPWISYLYVVTKPGAEDRSERK
ncbi:MULTISPECIES: class I SAM-dependent methyltransferase [unclassified Knoellia]|uniref:class I SAM-dependent methyltransferase n=1 Tax=Knoellia altitudinis TaxID=3404795 RepID=UPI00360DB88F